MKTNSLIYLFAAFFVISCSKSSSIVPNFIIGNKEPKGEIVSRDFSGNFDEIEVTMGISAEIVKADAEKVVVSAPSDIIDMILVTNKQGKLHIGVKSGMRYSTKKVRAKIYAKDFSDLEATSGASVTSRDQFTQEKTNISSASSGSINGNFEANDLGVDASSGGSFSGKIWAVNFNSDASSGGSINIKGKSKNATIDGSSGGSFSGSELVAEMANVTASSGGSVSLSVSRKLDANSSSGGSITIKKVGDPKEIHWNQSSGGSVRIQ